jgi:PIN domain nuclease of toxin-antitoxin system
MQTTVKTPPKQHKNKTLDISPVRKTNPVVTSHPPEKKKKQTQASWDKWVKECIVSVSPDVWNVHASELSHGPQALGEMKKMPKQVLLDTPTLDYLFRCPGQLSHNALLVLNDEEVECLVSPESLREWADKMRTGQYVLSKESGFFDKIFARFELVNTPATTELYQKYLSLRYPARMEISWERKPGDLIVIGLATDDRPTSLIAAHALLLGVPVVTPDLRYGAYRKEGLKTIW